jgi:tetratricopeptide (TPR) repeat protein
VSVAWHALNARMLFFFLRSATGSTGRSFWVSALFVVHPLHVESVAWISERKDLVATFFWFAGLLAYERWVRKPSPVRYLNFAAAFFLGLLAKPMLVTFPFTLLLLDFWPLRRWSPGRAERGEDSAGRRAWALVKEKIPLFLVGPGSAAAAFNLAQMEESLGHLDAAEKGYRKALELDPLEERSLLRLGTILVDRGDSVEAGPVLRQLARICFEGWAVGVSPAGVGMLCVRAELWPEARALLENALRDEPRNAEAWSQVGLACQRLRDYGAAAEAYRRAVEIEPRMAGARFNLGVACLQQGDFTGALEAHRGLESLDAEAGARLLELIRQEQARRGAGPPSAGR